MSAPTPIQRLARAGVLATCALALAVGPARGQEPRPLVVVTSRDDGPYAGVVEGAQTALAASARGSAVRVHSLQSGGDAALQALLVARKAGDTPLITVGSSATRAALEAPGNAPVIACM